jgi:hypothetical protein
MVIVAGVSRPYQVFAATAGSTYHLQVTGCAEFFRFRLLATNVPVITEQPVSQTVSSNASVLFTVAAIGVPPLRYQWRRNGIALPSETNGVLIIHNVTSEIAGTYMVTINNTGSGKRAQLGWWIGHCAIFLPPPIWHRSSVMTGHFVCAVP